jgi:hypothetical protein
MNTARSISRSSWIASDWNQSSTCSVGESGLQSVPPCKQVGRSVERYAKAIGSS